MKTYKYKKSLLNLHNKTRKNRYSGGTRSKTIEDLYVKKQQFRKLLSDKLSQIRNKQNTNQQKQTRINELIELISNREHDINTLIPINTKRRTVLKENSNVTTLPTHTVRGIMDFVSPLIVIYDSLYNIISHDDFVKILTTYYSAGGKFNIKSNKTKTTLLEHVINERDVEFAGLLLDKNQSFHREYENVSDSIKNKFYELTKLKLPTELPSNTDTGYVSTTIPSFWKPIFYKKDELFHIRNLIMNIYIKDKYETNKGMYEIKICKLLESIVPTYHTKYTLGYNEKPKNLMNTNILNCFITIIYGIISYKLRETNQKYNIIFKGGRAVQIAIKDSGVKQYFSEDTDILIVPKENSEYNLEEMKNLSSHIGYLVKWFLPKEKTNINIVISNPDILDRDITKLLYNDGEYYKALADIGFGQVSKNIKQYFSEFIHYDTSISFNIENPSINKTTTERENLLFITPTTENMLMEKIFFYSKYFVLLKQIERKEYIVEPNYERVTIEEINNYLYKFSKAIYKLLEVVVRNDYPDVENKDDLRELYIKTLQDRLKTFENEYQIEQRNQIIENLFPINTTKTRTKLNITKKE